jgi:hypothetical protein
LYGYDPAFQLGLPPPPHIALAGSCGIAHGLPTTFVGSGTSNAIPSQSLSSAAQVSTGSAVLRMQLSGGVTPLCGHAAGGTPVAQRPTIPGISGGLHPAHGIAQTGTVGDSVVVRTTIPRPGQHSAALAAG